MKETRGPVILLVDGDLDNREMYTEYLRTRGYEVIPCGDSRECVDLARRHHPDLILLELRVDRMSGIEILGQLKAERSLAEVPIVALTASVMPFQRREALAAGFTRVIPKPCMPEDLAAEIATMLSVPP